ncbi:MAG TPA: bifunctional [glutamine synthetase] adenylyltransferase/[glutamine synthetase]-adenylyl-L-tyrosine phosphorylase [Acidimicrobiales bacterium]
MNRAALPADVAAAVEHSAAPAAVGVALQRLGDVKPELPARLAADASLRHALVAVLGASRSLTQLCQTDGDAIDVLANLDDRRPCEPTSPDGLVRWKRLEFLRIAGRDLTGRDSLEAVGEGLARMADDVLGAAWRLAPGGADGIAVIAMGKYGGRELNYASDVDVLFVGEGDVRPALDLARRCFRVDADLRPEGRNGPLVRTLDAFRSYWQRWAKTWEFQALLKARAAAGDPDLGAAFTAAAEDALWSRPFGADELREVRAMKARAEEETARRGLTDRELKRGRGGIRDIEFAVQLLQLVHGHADPSLRSPTTLVALEVLAGAGYVDGDDAAGLAAAYRFLRMVEHRLQLWDEAQVHAVPAGGEALERLARVCGYRGTEERDAIGAFNADLRRHQATARSLHERLFFRPLLEAFSGVQSLAPGLPAAAVNERLGAFGFTEASRTREALTELTRGLTRTSRLMQQFLPLLLEWLSESPDPDGGLLGLRTLASGSHQAEALVRMFRDAPDGGRRLCRLLGSSRLVAAGLEHHPDVLADLADPARPEPVTASGLRHQLSDSARRRPPVERAAALRRFTESRELQIEIRDLLGRDDVDTVAAGLSTLAEAVLAEALNLVMEVSGLSVPVAVIAMGRFGGAELSYASDLDVIVVHGGGSDRDAAAAERVTTELSRLVNGPTPTERLWTLDLGLRPEGKQGPLARSLAGYEEYYRRWAQTWERQALLRGRFAAGDEELGDRFADVARRFLAREVTEDDEREIRRMKARIERERIPATDDPAFHLKLGRGGLADVEWTVQLLQLRHELWGHPGTMAALRALTAAGHVDGEDAAALAAAYEYCERTRNRLYLVRGAPGDALPARPDQLGKLARSLATTGPDLREEYQRVTRRCRQVTERLFYGAEGPPRRRTFPTGG